MSIRVVAWLLTVVILGLTIAHYTLAHLDSPVWRVVNLDAEGSFGSWFGAFTPLAAAALAGLLARDSYLNGRSWRVWAVLGVAMFLLSVDEVAQVHEGLSSLIGADIGTTEEDIMAGTPVIGLFVLPFAVAVAWGVARVATRRAALLMIVGLGVFWLGAFGMEQLEQLNHVGSLSIGGLSKADGDFVLVGAQEAVEMAGIALIVVGLLRQWAQGGDRIGLSVFDGAKGGADSARARRLR